MIERVARAIARASALDDGKEQATADNFTDAVWRDFIPAARDILTAMREPTAVMVENAHTTYPAGRVPALSDAWQAMIDAALGESVHLSEEGGE